MILCRLGALHVYKDIWSADLGDDLEAHYEPDNLAEKYAVCLNAIDGKIVGHLSFEHKIEKKFV